MKILASIHAWNLRCFFCCRGIELVSSIEFFFLVLVSSSKFWYRDNTNRRSSPAFPRTTGSKHPPKPKSCIAYHSVEISYRPTSISNLKGQFSPNQCLSLLISYPKLNFIPFLCITTAPLILY